MTGGTPEELLFMATQDEIHDPRFSRRHGATRGAPLGRYPIPVGSKLRPVECIHCSQPLGISSWEYLNGFLVVCPHCGGYHGKAWGFERTLLAGLFFSVLSFFFVMRPHRAIGAILTFVLLGWALLSVSVQSDDLGPYMIAVLGAILLGPVLINAVVLIRHQMLLDRAPPSAADGA